jgi:class 3 adenylate cyclase/tetratricopeptide (TPR) repeat protein
LRPASAETEAELRQLTVLFCDLVGSTSLAESLEPEDLREVTSMYQSICEVAIRRHDGYIAQYLGDGVLAYFGYPAAHEDDARRAVRAALEIIQDLVPVAGRLRSERGISLNIRQGIHTGPVVVGEVGGADRREQLAVGKTPNLAARIQNIAEPGTVLVSDDTYRIVRGYFDFIHRGAHDIRGLSETVTLHRVLRETGAASRLDVERRSGLTPLTGRDEEFTTIKSRWNTVSTSGGHAVLVQGEAGIGKSRIVDSLREEVQRQSATVLECFCTPYAQNTPLFPIIGSIERALGFTRETTYAGKRATLEAYLGQRGILSAEAFALMAELLRIPGSEADLLLNYSPQKKRERTLQTLSAWLFAVTRQGAAVWIIEDLHWVDPTTLEWLTSVIGEFAASPLLVVLTFRPDFAAPWPVNGRVSSLALSRLAPADTTSMAVRVAHGKSIPQEVLSQIVARTEGVPLFVEEVTKAVLELGVLVERADRFELSGPLPPGLIPSTVQASLSARLDRLGPAKGLAQLAATIGREFSFALLSRVAETDELELRSGLDRLARAELIYRDSNALEEIYLFKHALVRDAAYQSLLRKSRRALHERIAKALLSSFSETAEQHPELVAEHFTAAGQTQDAVKFWLQAGQLSVSRAANHEAITHLKRGLELVGQLPEAERPRQELEFLVLLIPALIAAESWASVNLDLVYRRAAKLVDIVGDTPHRFTVATGTFGYHFVAGRVTSSIELASQVFEMAQASGNPLLLTMALQDYSAVYCYHGDFRLADKYANEGLAMLDMEREQIIVRMMGLSSGVGLLSYQKTALWMLGFPERSKAAGERGVALAREIGHPPSIGFSLTDRTAIYYLQGDVNRTFACAEEALRVVHEERLGFYEPMITIYRGWALSELGEPAQGMVQIRDAIRRYRAAGNGIQLNWLYCVLAGAEWKAGQWNDAFNTLDTAMKFAAGNGEGLFEPELYRLKGEFLFAQASAAVPEKGALLAAAEASIRQAIDRAGSQEARMLELRSLVSLCRLRREVGSSSEECDKLAKAYDAFQEGFDTPDLREAKIMLEALKSGV